MAVIVEAGAAAEIVRGMVKVDIKTAIQIEIKTGRQQAGLKAPLVKAPMLFMSM